MTAKHNEGIQKGMEDLLTQRAQVRTGNAESDTTQAPNKT